MDVLAPGSVGSGWVLEQSPVTLMHGHELYYALAAAYSQIHLSSHWGYLFICFHNLSKEFPCKIKKKSNLTRLKNEADLEYFTEWVFVRVKAL